MLWSVLIAVVGLVVLGWVAKQTEAGLGLGEIGAGIQEMISKPLSPQIRPYLEVGLGPNLKLFFDWLRGLWAGAQRPGFMPTIPAIPLPVVTPLVPIVPTPPPVRLLSKTTTYTPPPPSPPPPSPLEGILIKKMSPPRMFGIDGSRL